MGKKASKLKRTPKSYFQDDSSKRATDNGDFVPARYGRLHNGCVSTVDAFQCGPCLSGAEDGSLVVFDPYGGQILHSWAAHQRGITKVLGASVNGKNFIFSASRDKKVKLWGLDSEMPKSSYEGHSLVVTAIACSPDGTHLISGSRDNTLCLWDIPTGRALQSTNLPRNIVVDMKWLGSTDLCAQSGEDKILKLWDSRTLSVAKSFPIKQYFQTSVDCSSDGLYIGTGSTGFNGTGCEVLLWDVRQGKVLEELKGHTQKVTSCKFGSPILLSSTEKPWIVSASADCSVRCWKQGTSDCSIVEVIGGAKELTSMTFVDDESIVIASLDYGVHLMKFRGTECSMSLIKTAQFY